MRLNGLTYECIRPTDLKNRTGSSKLYSENEAEVVRGGHVGVTTCQVAPIDRHMLNSKHRRNLALTFNVYRSVAYNCEILNGNRPLGGFLTMEAGGSQSPAICARSYRSKAL